MDDLDELLQAFEARQLESAWKLDLLLDLEPLRDSRLVPFFARVLADTTQPTAVRMAVLRAVRNRALTSEERRLLAGVMRELATRRPPDHLELREHSAQALGDFTDLEHVLATLDALASDPAEAFDVRYAAFNSLERAGPVPECVEALRRLTTDDTLGRSAHSLLVDWRVDQPREPGHPS
jgi:hypothetical protein